MCVALSLLAEEPGSWGVSGEEEGDRVAQRPGHYLLELTPDDGRPHASVPKRRGGLNGLRRNQSGNKPTRAA